MVVTTTETKEEKDKCVMCWEETPYTKDTHIDQRRYYVEGAGQLCKKCWKKIFKKDEKEE